MVCNSLAQQSQSNVLVLSSSSMMHLNLFKVVQQLVFNPHHFEGYVEDEQDQQAVKFFASTSSSGQQGDQGSSGVQGRLDLCSPLEEMSA